MASPSRCSYRVGSALRLLFVVLLLACGTGPAEEASDDPATSAVAEHMTAGSWSLAVLPDTQYYSAAYPEVFESQTSWLRLAQPEFDIRYVLHLGDLVDDNSPQQWAHAAAAMGELGELPYALVPGNHDYGPGGDASTRDTLMNDYFDFEAAAARDSFGGAFIEGRLDNTYHLLTVGEESSHPRPLVILALEWGPRDEVIAWARGVMDAHPTRDGILVTHAYMNNDDRRYDHLDTEHPQDFNPHRYGTPGGVNDGEELWQKLVRHHRFIMTLNGHVLGDGTGYLRSETDAGTVCHQMLSNYQTRPHGGDGYLRLLEFLPDGQTVRVHSYSPYLDDVLLDDDQHFDLDLPE